MARNGRTGVDATKHRKKAFLDAYSNLGNITAAAEVANVARADHYLWVKDDPQYLADFAAAEETAIQVMEREAHRRAVLGVEKPVYQGGHLVGSVQEYSDTLLIFLLKGKRPERYRERFDIQLSPSETMKRIAAEAGMEPEQLMAEAESILSGGK